MSNTFSAVVVDDEPYSRDELTYLLDQYEEIEIIGEAESGEKGLAMILKKEPDVVFIDIEMPQMSGMELAQALKNMNKRPFIIFATAYPDYAAKAFRVQAIDYLLKPFDEDQLDETVVVIKDRLLGEKADEKTSPIPRLAVETDGRITYLSPNDISYLFREEKETVICTKDKQYHVKTSIKDLEIKLNGYSFFRTHKSYLVNLDKVEELIPWFNGAYQVKMEGGKEEIPVSRNYVKGLREQLEL
ncbi:DNA-binding response regulator [Salibacterium salarium]|uniref:DNA-binding response regulator n=1 Tax=Salibacterium salarium TaxID=284579 RepID=A0A3R9QLN7_9BACI|nr:LytTR family DNA-binding domain-containing protein [Salibacterium salarium]RSL33108.1 DNA-binding response regulator [Salibacterium salarium]